MQLIFQATETVSDQRSAVSESHVASRARSYNKSLPLNGSEFSVDIDLSTWYDFYQWEHSKQLTFLRDR